MKNSSRNFFSLFIIAYAVPSFLQVALAAEVVKKETITSPSTADIDAKRSGKKVVRSIKRTGRKVMGTNTFVDDIKDNVEEAGDDISAAKQKNQRRNQ